MNPFLWLVGSTVLAAAMAPSGQDAYVFDRCHWLCFGWPGDYPKSFSFMGGAVMPGRVDPPIAYTVAVDGTVHGPDETAPDRREKIQWSLAEGFLPSPVSQWSAGAVAVRVQHFAVRTEDGAATVVFSRVTLTNADSGAVAATLRVSAAPDRHVPLSREPDGVEAGGMAFSATLEKGGSATFDFASAASGARTREQLKNSGGFDANRARMAGFYKDRIAGLAHPVALPNPSLVTMYKALQCAMWVTLVKAPNGDMEIRCSCGNPEPKRFYPYDRTFTHDVPNDVEQFILEGDIELARSVLASSYYQKLGVELDQNYLDAIPKYLVPYATYLTVTGDKAYFTPAIRERLKANARRIHAHREKQLDPRLKESGLFGILDKSNSFDNGNDYLVADNFVALHGLAAYEILSRELGDPAEAEWARKEAQDLTACLNAALQHTMKRRNTGYYNAAFEDDTHRRFLPHPGNWFSTTLMMGVFPWGAYLKGFDQGGTWEDFLDASIAQDIKNSGEKNVPRGSWGAWGSGTYGSTYNAGQGMQTLYSDLHRTEVVGNIEWLLENQSAPMQWGESFGAPRTPGDWTRPHADYCNWGLSLAKQALLQSCAALKSDGTMILGRGIPPKWLKAGCVIEWANVRVTNGKKLHFRIECGEGALTLRVLGDPPDGAILLDMAGLAGNIVSVRIDGKKSNAFDKDTGKVRVPPGSRTVEVTI